MSRTGRRWVAAGGCAAALALTLAACAPKAPPPVAPGAPKYPDFVFPSVPPLVGDRDLTTRHSRAWQILQSGDVRGAEQAFAGVLRRSPGFYPAQTGLAYAHVAGQQYKDAISVFDRAIALAPRYAPALAGRAEALLGVGRRDEALASFEAALDADPGLADLARRIEVLRFHKVRDLIGAGSLATRDGRLADARRNYTEALALSPDSALLYRELGLVELRLGIPTDAALHLGRAVDLDPTDAAAFIGLAQALEKTGDLPGAIGALERAYALDPTESTGAALARIRDRSETVALPPDFRAIPAAARITRGDLAALVGVRLRTLIERTTQRSGVVATDVRGHWAATWIMAVTRAGLMDVYANHTFQPRAAVRRADLAAVVSRVLAAAKATPPGPQRPSIADMSPDHLAYPAAAAAVSAGIMALGPDRLFRPSQAVTGAEAIDVVSRLERLMPKGRRD